MQLIDPLLLLLEVILFAYLFFISIYSLILSIAGLIKPSYQKAKTETKRKIAVFIPAYREDMVVYASASNMISQNYPKDHYDVYVIADSLKESTLRQLMTLPVRVVEVAFESSTKVKALNAAFDFIEINYDLCMVLDADNLAAPDFLALVNDHYNMDYRSVQGQRKPKNSDTKVALLDGLSEAINNHIVRKGTCVLGGSSAIVGSGFAVDYCLLKEALAGMDSVGGFDKELEIKLLQNGVKTIYVEEAVVYDEKVEDQEVFKKQRTRWISSQFFYLRKYFKTGVRAFLKGDFALFNSSVLRYAQLPRFLNLGFFIFFIGVLFILKAHLLLPFAIYFTLFIAFVASVFMAIPRSMYTVELLKAGLELPKIFLNMMLILFKLKGANRKFIHTPHRTQK